MAVSARQVKNKRNSIGELTGKAGTVYDVNIKYNSSEGKKTYSKKGFSTKKDAIQHEAEMRIKLINPSYTPTRSLQSKQTVKDYLEEWVENHGNINLRPSTFASYKGHIKNHIIPYVGHIQLNQLTPAMLDSMFQKLFEKGLSQSTVRYAQRILSVSLEAARKYRYIETNPARDIITKFGKQGKTPAPYTIEQMQQLMASVVGTEWEMLVMLGGMYGLRISEILGLRWRNVSLDRNTFDVIEQLPYKLPIGTELLLDVEEVKKNDGRLAPLKGKGKDNHGDEGRTLPITRQTRPYFEQQRLLQTRQKELAKASGYKYFDNDLVIAKANGIPFRRDSTSNNWGQFIRRLEMPHLRFHDLRHSAATNMHQLTGDFYTVGMILGHSLKGIGMSLGISTNLEAVTAQYVDVRLERKKAVLEAYHKGLHPTSVEKVLISL